MTRGLDERLSEVEPYQFAEVAIEALRLHENLLYQYVTRKRTNVGDVGLFLSIAEIAGVFVGFGALISVSRDRAEEARAQLRTVVTIGLVVLVAALLPVGLARYGLSEGALWGWSSGGFLCVIWVAILALASDSEYRAVLRADVKTHPALIVLSVAFLELPIQVPLVLVLLGIAPALAPAFYVTALVLNLFEAAIVLARLVFARS